MFLLDVIAEPRPLSNSTEYTIPIIALAALITFIVLIFKIFKSH